MYKLNEKIRDLEPYEPISGNYKIRLDANESYLNLPEYITAEIAAKLIDGRLNRYPDPLAAQLCMAFGKYYGVEPSNVVAGNGSDELISLLLTGFLMRGECYATLKNDFSMYNFYGFLAEGKRIEIPKNDDLTINANSIIENCNKEKVRVLIFSNPCNPTSIGIDKEKALHIVRSLPETLVVIDEAYMDFWNQSLLSCVNDFDNLLILKTCSKAFGLAALRVGFAVSNQAVIRAFKAIKSPYNLNRISQIMAETVLKHKGEARAAAGQIIASCNNLYKGLKPLEEFQGVKVLKSDTNFIVVKTEKAKDIFKYLLSIGIAVRCFDGFLRITAGNNSENVQVVKFIKKYLEDLT